MNNLHLERERIKGGSWWFVKRSHRGSGNFETCHNDDMW